MEDRRSSYNLLDLMGFGVWSHHNQETMVVIKKMEGAFSLRNTIFEREKAQSYIECMNEVYRRFIEDETTILLIRDCR